MRDFLLIQKAEQAFARTLPHPTIPGVRLTENPEHISAIFLEGVRGVEWVRQYPPDIINTLRTIDTNSYEKGITRLSRVPNALCDDIVLLNRIFRDASGSDIEGEVRSKSYLHNGPYGYQGRDSLPHLDGCGVRVVASYTLNPGLMTETYSADGSPRIVDEIEGELIDSSLIHEDNPENELKIKQRYGRGQVGWAHVLALKGHHGGLIHNAAAPEQGMFGFIYTAQESPYPTSLSALTRL
jgi:hypothetical protein